MMDRAFSFPHVLHFKQPATTSRGAYLERKVWYIILMSDDGIRFGIGECAPLPQLSQDDLSKMDERLEQVCRVWENEKKFYPDDYKNFPSIVMGMETAMRHLERNSVRLYDTDFSNSQKGIPFNGLVWMGNFEEMSDRIEEKIKNGFRCIKLKIGGIDFDQELKLIDRIRKQFSADTLELRTDANGAFTERDVFQKLDKLSRYQIHSIEQPIKSGQWELLARVCKESPIRIALDEELIGIDDREKKEELLDIVKPDYLILKPSLHGGFQSCDEWIELSKRRGIGFWITSALESNVGLNAIAQWCATLSPEIPQGLGTGMLFTDNIDYPLYIEKDSLFFDREVAEPNFKKYFSLDSNGR